MFGVEANSLIGIIKFKNCTMYYVLHFCYFISVSGVVAARHLVVVCFTVSPWNSLFQLVKDAIAWASANLVHIIKIDDCLGQKDCFLWLLLVASNFSPQLTHSTTVFMNGIAMSALCVVDCEWNLKFCDFVLFLLTECTTSPVCGSTVLQRQVPTDDMNAPAVSCTPVLAKFKAVPVPAALYVLAF